MIEAVATLAITALLFLAYKAREWQQSKTECTCTDADHKPGER